MKEPYITTPPWKNYEDIRFFKELKKNTLTVTNQVLTFHTSIHACAWFICYSGELINKLLVFLALLHNQTMQSSAFAKFDKDLAQCNFVLCRHGH